MHDLTLADLAKGLASGDFSSVELTQHFLDRIARYDGELGSFITTCPERALSQATAADTRIKNGSAQPLTGIPIAQKDIFCTQGVRTSCASKMLDNFIPPYDATVVSRLDAAGMVMLGKTNMDEFAMGSSNETSFYGVCKNPWNTATVPGGSSGGSAAAVAARLVPAATGTDTGGSIRQPAALCGITGLKPTYGRISRLGMVAFASSLDQAGPMAGNAEDCALLLQAMAGHDPKDSTSANVPVPDYLATLSQSIDGLTIGLPQEFFSEALSSDMAASIEEALKLLEHCGATVKTISLPHAKLAIPTYYVIAPAEASTNLSRYDGVRYGHRCDNPDDLNDMYMRTREEGFGWEVKRRILVGTYALSAGYYDAYYKKAQQVRRLIRNDYLTCFKDVDIIAAPTTLGTAFGLGEKGSDPVAMYMEDVFTLAANLAGLPAMAVPIKPINNMPAGMQLIGKHFDESTLLRTAWHLQQHSDWHMQIPATYARGAR